MTPTVNPVEVNEANQITNVSTSATPVLASASIPFQPPNNTILQNYVNELTNDCETFNLQTIANYNGAYNYWLQDNALNIFNPAPPAAVILVLNVAAAVQFELTGSSSVPYITKSTYSLVPPGLTLTANPQVGVAPALPVPANPVGSPIPGTSPQEFNVVAGATQNYGDQWQDPVTGHKYLMGGLAMFGQKAWILLS